MTTHVYGRPLSVGIKKDVIVTSKKIYGLNYPLGSKNTRGYFSKIAGVDLVKSNLNQLLKTNKGERVMLPDYGTNLYHFLFEPLDKTTFTAIKDDILRAIDSYAPGVEVIKLSVIPNDKVNYEGVQGLNINLTVRISDLDNLETDIRVEIG